MLSGPKPAVRRALQLRREMSLPEVLLRQELRKRRHGLKFRRQQPSACYVTDFYCHAAMLIVEVDGEQHGSGEQARVDAGCDARLRREGTHVLRIPARDVQDGPGNVVRHIVDVAESFAPLHLAASRRGPPLLRGGEL